MVTEVAAPGTARSTQGETLFGNETCVNMNVFVLNFGTNICQHHEGCALGLSEDKT
jgi:hypothetical protein